jgi:hypothetical protein
MAPRVARQSERNGGAELPNAVAVRGDEVAGDQHDGNTDYRFDHGRPPKITAAARPAHLSASTYGRLALPAT